MPVHSTAMHATLAALGTFATLLGASSWLAERICRAREARAARAALVGQSPQLGRPLRSSRGRELDLEG